MIIFFINHQTRVNQTQSKLIASYIDVLFSCWFPVMPSYASRLTDSLRDWVVILPKAAKYKAALKTEVYRPLII